MVFIFFKCKVSQDRSNKTSLRSFGPIFILLWILQNHKHTSTTKHPCLLACTVHLPKHSAGFSAKGSTTSPHTHRGSAPKEARRRRRAPLAFRFCSGAAVALPWPSASGPPSWSFAPAAPPLEQLLHRRCSCCMVARIGSAAATTNRIGSYNGRADSSIGSSEHAPLP